MDQKAVDEALVSYVISDVAFFVETVVARSMKRATGMDQGWGNPIWEGTSVSQDIADRAICIAVRDGTEDAVARADWIRRTEWGDVSTGSANVFIGASAIALMGSLFGRR